MSIVRSLVVTLVAVLMLATAALACPVCFDAANPNVVEEYRRSTMFLSLLPFGIVGGIAGIAAYLARRPLPPADDPVPLTTR